MAFEQQSSVESLETMLAKEIERSDMYASYIYIGRSTSAQLSAYYATIIQATESRIKRLYKEVEREKKRIKHEQKRIAHEQTTTPEGQSND